MTYEGLKYCAWLKGPCDAKGNESEIRKDEREKCEKEATKKWNPLVGEGILVGRKQGYQKALGKINEQAQEIHNLEMDLKLMTQKTIKEKHQLREEKKILFMFVKKFSRESIERLKEIEKLKEGR